MILDILTVLFFVSGLLLIFCMVRKRRRDVLHGPYVSKSVVVEAKVDGKAIGAPARKGPAKPIEPPIASLTSAADELSRIVREIEQSDAAKEGPEVKAK